MGLEGLGANFHTARSSGWFWTRPEQIGSWTTPVKPGFLLNTHLEKDCGVHSLMSNKC